MLLYQHSTLTAFTAVVAGAGGATCVSSNAEHVLPQKQQPEQQAVSARAGIMPFLGAAMLGLSGKPSFAHAKAPTLEPPWVVVQPSQEPAGWFFHNV